MAESNIVAGLFGMNPQMYGEQQRRSALQEGIDLAQLDPASRGAAMTYAGAKGLGGALAGAMGVQDPQLQMISQRQQIIQQLDLTNPASLARGVDLFTRTGDIQAAQALAMQSQTIAKQNQDRLKSEAETRKLGAETTGLSFGNITKQSQVQQLMSQFGMEETQATAIASNADLLKQYLTPKTQQGFELVKTGKFTPESVAKWSKGEGELEVIEKMVKPTQDFIAKAVELKFGEKSKYGDYTPDQVAKVNQALFNEGIAGKKAGAMALQIPLGDVLQKVFQSRDREESAKAYAQAGEAYTITIPLLKKLTDVESTVSNAFTGAGQNYKLALSKGLSSLGVKVSDRATDTEFADAISAQVVQQIAKVFPGSQSNKELDQLLKSKFNLQQELPTILRLVGQIKDEMLSQTKTYEQMANLPDNERTNFNAKLAQGKNYQKIQQYRDYEKKYLNKTITPEERTEAAKLKQELSL
jgi:hypothetical protein